MCRYVSLILEVFYKAIIPRARAESGLFWNVKEIRRTERLPRPGEEKGLEYAGLLESKKSVLHGLLSGPRLTCRFQEERLRILLNTKFDIKIYTALQIIIIRTSNNARLCGDTILGAESYSSTPRVNKKCCYYSPTICRNCVSMRWIEQYRKPSYSWLYWLSGPKAR